MLTCMRRSRTACWPQYNVTVIGVDALGNVTVGTGVAQFTTPPLLIVLSTANATSSTSGNASASAPAGGNFTQVRPLSDF